MSHTMNLQVNITDLDALQRAVESMGGKIGKEGTHRLYGSNRVKGKKIDLPGWKYPIVLKEDGSLSYDRYQSKPDAARIEELKAEYGLEKAKIEARRRGYSIQESVDETGNKELTI